MPLRFDADYSDTSLEFEPLVDEVFSELRSTFLEMPRGDGFIDYGTFEKGYQTLKRTTGDFVTVTNSTVEGAVAEAPIAFIVFRAILGFTPPEWAYVTTEMTGVTVDQGAARSIDRNMRMRPLTPRPFSDQEPHDGREYGSAGGPAPSRQSRYERRDQESPAGG